jgi:hypothetical protein
MLLSTNCKPRHRPQPKLFSKSPRLLKSDSSFLDHETSQFTLLYLQPVIQHSWVQSRQLGMPCRALSPVLPTFPRPPVQTLRPPLKRCSTRSRVVSPVRTRPLLVPKRKSPSSICFLFSDNFCFAYSPAAAGALLTKAQKSLNQTVAAGARVVNKCGGAVASAANATAATATAAAAASATDAAAATITNSTAATDTAAAAAASVTDAAVRVS